MARKATLALVAVMLVALGWIAGHAQVSTPDFEVRIDAPVGTTEIECVRGCKLAWVERGSGGAPQTKFHYSCSGQVTRCSSGRVGGWLGQ